jgi:hypothetical protein
MVQVVTVIALFGVLFVATLGFHQSGWAQESARQTNQLDAQASAKRILWEKLERINILLRARSHSNPEIFRMIRSFNEEFLLNSMYLDDDTQQICNDYLHSLERLRIAVYTSGNDNVINFYERTIVRIPRSMIEEIDHASAESYRLREAVRAHLAYTRR